MTTKNALKSFGMRKRKNLKPIKWQIYLEINKMTKIPRNLSNDQKYPETYKMTKKNPKTSRKTKNTPKYSPKTSKMTKNTLKSIKWPKYPLPKSLKWQFWSFKKLRSILVILEISVYFGHLDISRVFGSF